MWRALTGHEPTRTRYLARVHQRHPAVCWYWLGAISDTGHGKLRAGSRAAGAAAAGAPASRVVTSHVFGYHLEHGPAAAEGTAPLVIAHACDEASCHNPGHWKSDDARGNTVEYMHRRGHPDSPLADRRGPAGRARAIARAIRAAIRAGAGPDEVDAVIASVIAAGMPPAQLHLFELPPRRPEPSAAVGGPWPQDLTSTARA